MCFAFSPFRIRLTSEASKWLHDGPRRPQEGPKKASRGAQENPKRGPRKPEERPKKASRGAQEGPGGAQTRPKNAPIGPQHAHSRAPENPRAHGPPMEVRGTDFGPSLGLRHMYTHIYIYAYICIYVYMYGLRTVWIYIYIQDFKGLASLRLQNLGPESQKNA